MLQLKGKTLVLYNQKDDIMNDYRILVVDDEEDLCEILKFNLENASAKNQASP